MVGRTLEIPQEIKKIYATGPLGTIFLYTLAPDFLAGWNNDLRPAEKKYILPKYHTLPVLGTWRGTNTSGSVEELLKVDPDVIINMGDVDPKYIADTEKIQDLLGIPVLMADGSLDNLEKTYQFMGNLLGVEKRAKQLADYSLGILAEIQEKTGKIPVEKRLTVYYAEGPKGLETEPKGSLNGEVIELSGGINVADPGLDQPIKRMQVSLEQVLTWNPDVIIISSDGDSKHEVYNTITTDGAWQHIEGVKSKKVYEIPYGPYDWLNRPPSIMRILGIQWLTNVLYPEVYNVDINEKIKDFFEKFYSYELSEEEINELLRSR